MKNFVYILIIIGIFSCNDTKSVHLLDVTYKKGKHAIEDILYVVNDNKLDTLFYHCYFVDSDSISYFQKPYLNIGVCTKINYETDFTKNIQFSVIEKVKIRKFRGKQTLQKPFINYKLDANFNGASRSESITFLNVKANWVMPDDQDYRDLGGFVSLGEFVLKQVYAKKDIQEIFHRRTYSIGNDFVVKNELFKI